MTEKQILIDIWEGDTNLDHSILINNGVKGMVVRLNNMSGGHHLDARFAINYQDSKKYLTNALYFVYNPWVKGKPNLDWFLQNVPSDFNGRVFVDLEVIYKGYDPKAYANEVDYFFAELSKKYKLTPYTGAGYLQIMSYWPKTDYWWASYPYALYPSSTTKTTWQDFYTRINAYPEIPSTIVNACPTKNIKLWQCTGDRLILEGMEKHAVDLNIFYGTEDELVTWMGGKNPTTSGSIVLPEDVDPPHTDTQVFHNINTMNIREYPTTDSKIVGSLPANSEIVPMGTSVDTWYKINNGWVCRTKNGQTFIQ